MMSPCYVNEVKVECENSNYPSIDTGTRRDVGISEHPSINFDYKILNSNNLIESDRAESIILVFGGVVDIALAKMKSYSDVGCVDGKNDRSSQCVVDGT
jgi:hypothetical protein